MNKSSLQVCDLFLDEYYNLYQKSDTFLYRKKAFDNIEFGTHKDYYRKIFTLLNLDFKFYGHIDKYYGLYKFMLSGVDEFDEADMANAYLKDISSVIDDKYQNSQLINKEVNEGHSALLLQECKIFIDENFDSSKLPEDEGIKFIFKRFKNEEIEIEIGYRIKYKVGQKVLNGIVIEKPKLIKFYALYINFENIYLEKLVNLKEGNERQKSISSERSKF